MREYRDIISGCIFLILAITLYICTFSIRSFSDASHGVTFLPRVVAFLMAGVSLIVIHGGITKLRIGTSQEATPEMRGFFKSALLIFLYIALLPALGFILDTFIYIIVQTGILSGFNRKKVLLSIPIGAVSAICIYLIFSRLIYIMLPAGILG